MEHRRRGRRILLGELEEELLERFMVTLGQRRIGVHALIPQQATLEQLFFQLTEQDAAPPPPVLHAVAEEAV